MDGDSKTEKATPKKPNWIYDDEPLCPCCGEVLDGTEEHIDRSEQSFVRANGAPN